MKRLCGIGMCGLVLTSACSAAAPADAFRRELAAKYQEAAEAKRLTVPGTDGWLFQANELRFLSVGPFWGDAATSVSRATKPTSADPVPGIVGFHQALKDRDVELIVVPVPAKAALYPDKISSLAPGARYDEALQAFYAELRDQGVQVLDLTDAFMAMDVQSFCKTDTHWSPAACQVAAREIAAMVRGRPWRSAIPTCSFTADMTEISFTGDLWEGMDGGKTGTEKLPFTRISKLEGGAGVPVVGDESSPVVLMGDSHTIVFQDGSLLAAQGGLPDLLSYELGFELDLQFRNKGSGSSVVRKSLARKQFTAARTGEDYLATKKLVVWCFTAREFTEATDGWPVMPVGPK